MPFWPKDSPRGFSERRDKAPSQASSRLVRMSLSKEFASYHVTKCVPSWKIPLNVRSDKILWTKQLSAEDIHLELCAP
ncbi:hypothetical protein TNCV_1716201 [Trichonephila clavipes]|nr:hypothetical protein TNCV_1716201 [Trichonephila clavipes]